MTAPTIIVKRCPKCGETKPVSGFHRNRAQSSGLASYCKECNRAKARAYYEAHRDEISARERAYYEAHREEKRAYNRDYREAHREEQEAYNRARNALLGKPTQERWQEITAKHSTHCGRWSEAEDAYLAASTDRIVDDAIELKRTYKSVGHRLAHLRARGVTLARDAHRR